MVHRRHRAQGTSGKATPREGAGRAGSGRERPDKERSRRVNISTADETTQQLLSATTSLCFDMQSSYHVEMHRIGGLKLKRVAKILNQ